MASKGVCFSITIRAGPPHNGACMVTDRSGYWESAPAAWSIRSQVRSSASKSRGSLAVPDSDGRWLRKAEIPVSEDKASSSIPLADTQLARDLFWFTFFACPPYQGDNGLNRRKSYCYYLLLQRSKTLPNSSHLVYMRVSIHPTFASLIQGPYQCQPSARLSSLLPQHQHRPGSNSVPKYDPHHNPNVLPHIPPLVVILVQHPLSSNPTLARKL
jgi:hypothetical protein